MTRCSTTRGLLWYERDFSYEPVAGHKTFLHIGAANYTSIAWVNGQEACRHEGGFTAFDCDVSSSIHTGRNFVVIAVDNTRLADGVPTLNMDWWNWLKWAYARCVAGGCTGEVHRRLRSASESRSYGHRRQCMWKAARQARKCMSRWRSWGEVSRSEVRRGRGGQLFRCQRPGFRCGRRSLRSSTRCACRVRATARTTKWGSGNDRSAWNGHSAERQAGGFCVQHLDPWGGSPCGGRANSDEDAATLLGWAKELGCNYVRLAHYPHDQRMTRTADRLGLMVWPEYSGVPGGNQSSATLRCWRRLNSNCRRSIWRDRDKASIVLWSIANETLLTPERTAFLKTSWPEMCALDPNPGW